MKTSLRERFEEKYIPEPNSGCWIWTACTSRDGYGQIALGGKFRVSLLAHRVSYELHKEPIGEGLSVLHKCDTPACVNPDHLLLGTQNDNVQDMVKKGRNRHPYGEYHPQSKLTFKQVAEIRKERATKKTIFKDLAKKYGVSATVVCGIVNKKNWARHDP